MNTLPMIPGRQRGAVLVVGLIFLVMLSLLGVAA
jgi:Tfp pilus assembly protein PilX